MIGPSDISKAKVPKLNFPAARVHKRKFPNENSKRKVPKRKCQSERSQTRFLSERFQTIVINLKFASDHS